MSRSEKVQIRTATRSISQMLTYNVSHDGIVQILMISCQSIGLGSYPRVAGSHEDSCEISFVEAVEPLLAQSPEGVPVSRSRNGLVDVVFSEYPVEDMSFKLRLGL